MSKVNCCYECEKRHVGCHSTCEAYLRFASERKAELEARIAENEAKYLRWKLHKKSAKAERDKRSRERKKRESLS